jgi:HK97 family phage prohead protease
MNLQKTCNATFKAIGDGITKFTAIITTHAIDRDQDVVIPSGMNSKEYEANPVLLYSHDPNKPIGKMVMMRRGESSIDADFVLAPRPDTHEGEWLPDTVGALMKFGALKGVSIGYMPVDGGMRSANKADASKYGDGVKRVYSKWKLLEVSVVSIPSNQEALINAVSKGIVSKASLAALGCNVPIVKLTSVATEKMPVHRVQILMPKFVQSDITCVAKTIIAKMRGQFR